MKNAQLIFLSVIESCSSRGFCHYGLLAVGGDDQPVGERAAAGDPAGGANGPSGASAQGNFGLVVSKRSFLTSTRDLERGV